ncbi:MAG: MG2 domain-containing protein [Bacteroidales bacterium]
MKKLVYLLIIGILLMTNCSESIKLSRNGFSEIVPLGGNITFNFNQDMVTKDKLNVWDTTQYVLFNPPLYGKFKWKSQRELIFSPYHYLRPSTLYQARFNTAISSLITDNDEPVEFHTPYFELKDFKAYFARLDLKSNKTVIRYDFGFNYKIKPQDLKSRLEIKINDKKVNYELIGNELSERISVFVESFDVNEKDLKTEIKIAKGLKILNFSVSNADILRKSEIIDPEDIEIESITAEHDGFTGTITITANQDVVESDLKKFIEIIPAVDFSISVEGSLIYVKSEKFDLTKTYTINIKEGLMGTLGGKLKNEYTEEVSFGKLDPEIKILDKKAEYLSANGFKNFEIRIVSVPNVRVVVKKVYKNNLLGYLNNRNYSEEEYYESEYEDEYYYYDYGPKDVGDMGDVVFEKDIATASLPESNGGRLFKFDFTDKLANHQGIFVFEIYSKEDYWIKDRKIIALSDIGLIAKQGRDRLYLFANSIETAKPLAKVKLEITARNNQSLGTVETNDEGFAEFSLKERPAEGFVPAIVTASLGNDFTALPFNRTQVGTSRYDIDGKTPNLAGYDAYIYGDRDIYRPGETMNISVILRDDDWNVPGQIPVQMRILAPNGKVFRTVKKTLNKFGSFETDVTIPVTAPTGSYTIEVLTSTGVYLNSKYLKVEEFVPDRIKVNASSDKQSIDLGQIIKVNIAANNLFGPPAANRNYEVQENIKRLYFYAPKYRKYSFELKGAKSYFESNVRTGKTNEQGIATEDYKYPFEWADMGLLGADYFVTVFDETGRPVNRYVTTKIYTQDKFYGISLPDYYNKTNKQMSIPLIVVNKSGEALSGVKAQVKLIRHDYKTVLTKSGDYFRYKSEHEEIVLEDKTIDLNGDKTNFNFVPKLSGRYDIRISKPGTSTYVEESFYAYGYGSTTSSSFQVNNEGNIDIELDKPKYNVGEKAKVILNTPFSGKVLVTVEGTNVSDHFYLKTDNKAVSFDLEIKNEYVPNVYISATLIKPHSVSDIPLTVAHGYAPVLVENPANKMSVSITAADKSSSKTKQKIRLKAKPNSAVTLAIVDEGILQVTGFTSPDPYGFFYRKRALGVDSYDIYPYLFPEIEMKTGKEGGGSGEELEKRVNPMTNKRFKLVSFWSGILTTDNSGNLEYEIDIPQFSGDLRIMAVAYDGKSFGASSSNMKVADPIVISTALPRFLSPKDSVEMSVTLSNTTSSAVDCNVNISTDGPVKISGAGSQQINIPANSEKQVYCKLAVLPEIGEAKVKVAVNAVGKNYSDETDITVRPASPLQKTNGSGSLMAGSTKQIEMDMNRFLKQSMDNKLIVSNSPMVQFANNLDYLVQYPYGCVEQTVSSVFPQLYFKDLAKDLSKNVKLDVENNIKSAIRKLQLMQLYNGGMSYWPGSGEESWWGSIYAAHFLVEAKKAGYEIDPSVIEKLMEYMKSKLKSRSTISYWYNGNLNKKIAPKEVAYSLYVLALNGDARVSSMNYYKSHPDLLSLDSKYLLAVAYSLSGDKSKYKQMLPAEFSGEVSKPEFGGSFYSPIRDEAIALNALLETDPDNQQVGIMAKHLSEKLKTQRYLNTQEQSFAFIALGKIARKASQSNITGQINSDAGKIADYNNATLNLKTSQLGSGKINITTKGKGQLYYFWEAEGISKDGSYVEEDKYLKVRRSFYDRFGKPIMTNNFKQNDLIVVKISIQGNSSTYIDNVVIADILPAGFEIENPRISTVPGMDWIKDKSFPVYTDFRDDRINFFVTVSNTLNNYYYIVRAVTPGVFQMGPVGADAMYNGEYHSYHGGGIVRITRN